MNSPSRGYKELSIIGNYDRDGEIAFFDNPRLVSSPYPSMHGQLASPGKSACACIETVIVFQMLHDTTKLPFWGPTGCRRRSHVTSRTLPHEPHMESHWPSVQHLDSARSRMYVHMSDPATDRGRCPTSKRGRGFRRHQSRNSSLAGRPNPRG